MKSLYKRLNNQSDSLKGLWAAKLGIEGSYGKATEEDIMAYDAR